MRNSIDQRSRYGTTSTEPADEHDPELTAEPDGPLEGWDHGSPWAHGGAAAAGSPGEASESPQAADSSSPGAAPLVAWSAETVQRYQDRWREIALQFVDRPPAATAEAQTLLADVVEEYCRRLSDRKAQLDGWGDDESADTEQLRLATRRYRDLLDQLLRT